MSTGQWNLIESDPGVFTELIEKLHVEGVEVQELYSPLALAEHAPLYGVIFLFKYTDIDRSRQPLDGVYQSQLPTEAERSSDVFFARQMINNACATQAVLNILLNRDDVELGSELSSFKDFISSFDSEMKGETMTNSELIRTVHNSFSSPNMFEDDRDRTDDDKSQDLFHFIGFIQRDGRIWELDGLRPEPIAHERCSSDTEFIQLLPAVLQRRMNHYPSGELQFSLLSVMKDRRLVYEEAGDYQSLQEELDLRERWKIENSIRRTEMTGLVYETLKLIAKHSTAGEWNNKLLEASKRTQSRLANSI